MKYILETKSLLKQFGGVAATNKLSIGITEGKVTGIIGPNGSGKTTLVNLLTGLIAKDDGSVYAKGVDMGQYRAYDVATYGITRTFQRVRLFEELSVIDNLLVVLTERGVFRSLFETHTALHVQEAETLLKKVGLSRKRNEKAGNLSYGQRKLLEIARALAMKADIYLFDEPFAGLFPEMVVTVKEILKELAAHGKSVILIEHNMDLIRELSDEVLVIDAGTLLAKGAPQEVLAKKEVIEAYLGT